MNKAKTIKALEKVLPEESPVSFHGFKVTIRVMEEKDGNLWQQWLFEKDNCVVSLVSYYNRIKERRIYEAMLMRTDKELGTFQAFRTAVRKVISTFSQ